MSPQDAHDGDTADGGDAGHQQQVQQQADPPERKRGQTAFIGV